MTRLLPLALTCLLAAPLTARAELVRNPALPMVAVAGYDKVRLVGEWFEVAQSTSALQVDCHGVTSAITTRDDSRLNLKMACHKGRVDGPVLPIEGVMVETAPGLFQVRFLHLAQLGNLELAVLWAAPDDCMVFLGAALGQVGWVLAKERAPDAAALAAGVQVLVDNGYALGAIAPVEQ